MSFYTPFYPFTHLARVVAFMSAVEALDAPQGSSCFTSPGPALVDVQTGGRHVNHKQTDQVAEIE